MQPTTSNDKSSELKATYPHESCWYVYMLETLSGKLYTGITTNVKRRWNEHCSGKRGAKSLRGDKPQQLLLVETSPNRSLASRREAQIKRLTVRQKRTLIRCQAPVYINPDATPSP